MGKTRGMGAGRKLKTHRRNQRWADKAYKKSHLGNEWKKPFAGSSHAKGIVLEKIGIEAKQPNSAIRKCARVQLVKNGKKIAAFVPNDGCLNYIEENASMDNRHLWTEEEELALFQEAETLLKTQKYSKQSARNACLMARMNERFPGVAIKFTVGVIKNKLSLFKERWLGRHTLITCKGKPIPCSQDMLNILFAETGSASESTNSGAADAGAADSVNVNYGMQQGEAVSVNVNYGMQQNNGIVGYSIMDCITLVESIQELTTEEKVDAANIMRFEGMARVMFMNFTDPAVRLCWIKKELAKLPKDH